MIGVAARMCLEMGLHRRDALTKIFRSEDEMVAANRLFWSVYSLDRRWSLGTGLPFVIQDEDIDSSLPEPVSISSRNFLVGFPILTPFGELRMIRSRI